MMMMMMMMCNKPAVSELSLSVTFIYSYLV